MIVSSLEKRLYIRYKHESTLGVYSPKSHTKERLSCQHKTNPFKHVYITWNVATSIV
jgi:hypothetical protein